MQFIPHLYSVSRKSCAQVRRESLDDSIPYSYRPFLSFSPTWNYTILQRQRTKNPSSHSPFYIINIHIDITIFPNPKREGNKFRKNIYTKNYLFAKLYKNVNKDQYFISTIHHFSLFFHEHCSTKLFKKKIVHDKNLQIRRSFETSSQKTSRVKVVPLEIRPYSREGRRKEGRRGAGFHSPLLPPWRRGNAIFSSFHVPLPRTRSLLAPPLSELYELCSVFLPVSRIFTAFYGDSVSRV